MTDERRRRRSSRSTFWQEADVGGVGGTLAGNALSIAAARATLVEVLTDEAFDVDGGPCDPAVRRHRVGDRRATACPGT